MTAAITPPTRSFVGVVLSLIYLTHNEVDLRIPLPRERGQWLEPIWGFKWHNRDRIEQALLPQQMLCSFFSNFVSSRDWVETEAAVNHSIKHRRTRSYGAVPWPRHILPLWLTRHSLASCLAVFRMGIVMIPALVKWWRWGNCPKCAERVTVHRFECGHFYL